MKKLSFLFAILLLFVTSCSNDDDPIVNPEAGEKQLPLVTEEIGATIVNTREMEIGSVENDIIFDMVSTVMTSEGHVKERTLNCCGIGAVAIVGGEQDFESSIEKVTLINKGTITVHTKDLVERYIDQIQSPQNANLRYKYFRIIVMYGGKNNLLINEGTINVYFDHDPDITPTVYVMAMAAGEGSSILNKGEIHFYGNGSVATRMRGMATFGDNITAINEGIMTATVGMADDSRMITTGGKLSNVINNGILKMQVPGTVCCMTRYGDSNLINNNLIEITSVCMPDGYTPVVSNENYLICALYEALQDSRTAVSSPLINRGNIHVTLSGSNPVDSHRQGFGMLCDLQGKGTAEAFEVNIHNEGNIVVKQDGNQHYNLAEAGFFARNVKAACHIKLGRWNTTLRDFSNTHDLFLLKGSKVNFTGGEVLLSKEDGYVEGTAYSIAPEALLYRADDTHRYEYTGYENLNFIARDTSTELIWDQENQMVSLKKK